MDDLTSKIIAGFRIVGLIGKGGMGSVYKAHDTQLGRDVALKVMDPQLARDEAFMKRFRIEARALAQLHDTRVVNIYSLQETEIGTCIIMEYVEGQTLADLIKHSGRLDPSLVFNLFRQILLAIEHAHTVGIIHRDIKPSNILLTKNDEVKIADFGLAKLPQHSGATMTQLTGGTLYYSSPEQMEGLPTVDHRSDIYSVGMTLYEALTGQVPFSKTESDFRIREKIVNGKIPPPKELNPGISKGFNALVMKAIARHQDHRFQSAGEMRLALERADTEERARLAVGKERTGRFSKKAVAWTLSAVALVVVGLIVKEKFAPAQDPPVHEQEVASSPAARTKDTAETVKLPHGPEKTVAEDGAREKVDTQEAATESKSVETKKQPDPSLAESRLKKKGATVLPEEREMIKPRPAKTAEVITIPPAEKSSEPEKPKISESSILDATNRELNRLKDEYVTNLEREDLGSLKRLLQLNDAEEQGWEIFFEKAKYIKVSVEQYRVAPQSQTNAEVSFRATISYFNITLDETVNQMIQNKWQCENHSGKWLIVSRNLR